MAGRFTKAENTLVGLVFQLRAYQERRRLTRARSLHGNAYDGNTEPLITITIATFNRAEILTRRTLPIVLAQTYQNFEIVIVGDHCTDDTEQQLQRLGDSRIRFINLPERGRYPQKRERRWESQEQSNKPRIT